MFDESTVAKLNAARIIRTRPTAPSLTSSDSRFVCGLWRYMNASISRRPARSAASNAACTSAVRRLSGFSHSTCFPALSAFTVQSTWSAFGSEM